MQHAVLTRELVARAKRKKRNFFMVQIDFSNTFGSVPQELIEYHIDRTWHFGDVLGKGSRRVPSKPWIPTDD
jgi:DNA-binding transcriptional regulator GbsR (MarR family)